MTLDEGGQPWAEVLQREFGRLSHGVNAHDTQLLATLRIAAAADSVLLVFDDRAGRRIGVRIDADFIWDAADPPVGAMKPGDLGTVAWMIMQTMILDPAHGWELGAPDQDGVRWRKADPVRPRCRFWRG